MKILKRGIAQITDATIGYGIVAIILVSVLIPLSQWAAEAYRLNIAAGQANTVQKAVNHYIADQHAVIAARSSVSSGYTLTVPMLITAGYLPAGFASTTPYTATYRTLIFQPVPNRLHSMTFMSGGTPLSLSQARKLANSIGAAGGYIENGVAKGALGSWQENLSAFGGYNPGDGSVVIAGFYANGARVNDYLYRHAVAGYPELNTMGTALNMGGNDITTVRDVNARNGYFSESVQSGGAITANKDLTANGMLRGSHDLVLGGVVKLQQVNTAGASCDTWGAISRDNAGAILSCQSGIWHGGGSTGRYTGAGHYVNQYDGHNQTSHTITVYASGGTSVVPKEVGSGGSCRNAWALAGYVGDALVANAFDNNTDWAKSGFLSFQVPGNTGYRIVSDPNPTYGCSPGAFWVYIYQ